LEVSKYVLLGIKAVKDSKKVKDMYDRRQVQLFAFEMGFYETANWLNNHKDEYFLLLLQTDWDNVMSVYKEESGLKK